jgi:hypothetical protein
MNASHHPRIHAEEIPMALKGGKLKTFILVLIFLVVFSTAFVLLGGGNFLKTAGNWMSHLGSKADTMKGTIEEGAKTVGQKAEKVKEAVTSAEQKVEKKVGKVKDAVTSGDKQ